MSDSSPGPNIFRSEAIEYHRREQESIGIVDARLRWGWPAVLISAVLLVASVTYLVCTRSEIVHVIKGRLEQ